MKPIPLDQLRAKTSLGFQIKSFYPDESFDKKAKDLGAHRDDHYLFFLLKRGNGSLTIDWQQVNMGAGQLFYNPTLCRQFKRLMAENIRTIKSPATYSNRLNVSLSYLNQSVKSMTGLPVRYWIQQEILVEAKRLLYHTQLNVQQIAYELGYEDAAYFSRFFRRSAGMSALAFRATLSRTRQ